MNLVSHSRQPAPSISSAPVRFYGQDWMQLKALLDNRYAQLTEEDLDYVPGQEDALFDRMVSRTMESRENIERFLREECGCAL